MTVDPHVQRFLRMLAAASPTDPSRATLVQRRDGFRNLMRLCGSFPAVGHVEDRSVPGRHAPIPIRVYHPASLTSDPGPGLIYFHGGGLVAGDLDTHDSVCRMLATAIGSRLISVSYPLAPEHKFPAAVNEGRMAAEWVLDNAVSLGLRPDRIGIAGDSAGGTLAAVICQTYSRVPTRQFAYLLLLCPILDPAGETASRRAFTADPLVSRAMMDRDLEDYLPPGHAPSDPRVSPLRFTDLSGSPPAFIHTAEFDPLRDEGAAYARRLSAEGVTVSYCCHPGMIHLFYAMSRLVPYTDTAIRRIGDEIRSLIGSAMTSE